jgi:hypothetical protein
VESSFLKQQADRCRWLAERADAFTKRCLLDLAAKYEDRLGRPSRATKSPPFVVSLSVQRERDVES